MKLYSDPYAPNPRRVLWLMTEKGIEDIEVVPVALGEGEHKRAPFADLHPGLPRVPLLELDDGTAIPESLAICRYLETLHPEPNLFGRDPLESALIEAWTRQTELLFAAPLMLAVRYGHPALAAVEPDQSHKRAAANRAAADAALPILERRLGKAEWLGGGRFSIADIVAGSSLMFAKLIGYGFTDAHPNLQRWSAATLARPGARSGR